VRVFILNTVYTGFTRFPYIFSYHYLIIIGGNHSDFIITQYMKPFLSHITEKHYMHTSVNSLHS